MVCNSRKTARNSYKLTKILRETKLLVLHVVEHRSTLVLLNKLNDHFDRRRSALSTESPSLGLNFGSGFLNLRFYRITQRSPVLFSVFQLIWRLRFDPYDPTHTILTKFISVARFIAVYKISKFRIEWNKKRTLSTFLIIGDCSYVIHWTFENFFRLLKIGFLNRL